MKTLIRKLLGAGASEQVKRIWLKLDGWLVRLCSRNGLLASLYYVLFSRKFDREHQAVLQGRLVHHKTSSGAVAMLRRNIHRLEKGLIMQPRRPVFAEAYITQTVDAFVKLYPAAPRDSEPQYDWAHQVLACYFDTVSDSKIIVLAKQKFQQHQGNSSTQSPCIPYARHQGQQSQLSYESFLALCQQRRSVRWFKPKPVEKSQIEKAIAAATLAPSACNRQPFEYVVTNVAELAQELGAIPMGTAGFSHNFQSVVVLLGDLSAYPYERDRHVIYIDASLSAMQFMLSLETLGLSSCVINWPDLEVLEAKLQKRLQLPTYVRPIMFISVGYADDDGLIPYSQKKTPEQLIREVTPC